MKDGYLCEYCHAEENNPSKLKWLPKEEISGWIERKKKWHK